MPRPKKWRRVEIIPNEKYFIPFGKPKCELSENILKVEELEAMRLKDLELLDQDACAERMQISRQTFQRILAEARAKVTDALLNDKALSIRGGNYTLNVCTIKCLQCGRVWEEKYENLMHRGENADLKCPKCNATEIVCTPHQQQRFCHRHCCKRRQEE